MPVSDIDLLPMCAEFTLSRSRPVNDEVSEQLQTSARTSLVTALRMLRLQRSILSVGMFSLFESMLQDRLGWSRPFEQLKGYLTAAGHYRLARTFDDYRLAVNVLKHGRGRSYEQLVARSGEVEFKVKPPEEDFFHEGDVSEVGVLIDVDDGFVRRCAAVIEEVSAVLRSKERVWM
jgi:hypothetical protein